MVFLNVASETLWDVSSDTVSPRLAAEPERQAGRQTKSQDEGAYRRELHHPELGSAGRSFVMGQQYLSPRPGGKIYWVREGHLNWLRSHQPVARAGEMWIYDNRRP